MHTFERVREDHPDSCLNMLTDSVDRLLVSERAEWARALQRRQLTSGAIDAEATLDKSGGATRGGKGTSKSTQNR